MHGKTTLKIDCTKFSLGVKWLNYGFSLRVKRLYPKFSPGVKQLY
jgi:hypothetical protein